MPLLAVRGSDKVLAVVGIAIPKAQKVDSFEKNLTVAILDECGLALEKELTARAKQQIEEQAQQETLRANLLRAISHDLRTPLTSISGNAGILMENAGRAGRGEAAAAVPLIYDDSMWLANLVENLLSVTRIENGRPLNIQPELLEEVFERGPDPSGPARPEHTITCGPARRPADGQHGRPADRAGGHQSRQQRRQVHAPRVPHPGSAPGGERVQVRIADDGPGIPDEAKAEAVRHVLYRGQRPRRRPAGPGAGPVAVPLHRQRPRRRISGAGQPAPRVGVSFYPKSLRR